MFKNQRGELLQHLITGSEQLAHRFFHRFNRERTEANRVVLAHCVERVDRTRRIRRGLWNEQRVT